MKERDTTSEVEQRGKTVLHPSAPGRASFGHGNREKDGVRNSLVSAWVKRYLEEGEDALEPKNGNPYAALHTSKTLSEVDRLRLIIAKQEVEIARLKKGYWVEGVGAKKEYVTGSGKNTKSSKN